MQNKVEKPWGWYEDLERHYNLVIKKLHVSPGQKIPLQKHFKRDEFWYVLSGIGKVQIDNVHRLASEGETFSIGRGQTHRLEAHADGITILEVQRGECSEDDIIRLEDDYDRVTDGL